MKSALCRYKSLFIIILNRIFILFLVKRTIRFIPFKSIRWIIIVLYDYSPHRGSEIHFRAIVDGRYDVD